VHVVVTCTNRKSRCVPRALRLRDVPVGAAGPRANAWIDRLESDPTPAVPALDLYCGEHWHVARRLVAPAAHASPTLWVCSAGYGLVRADATLRPYAATFSPGHADSVGADAGTLAGWWGTLAGWPGPQPGTPRRLAELAAADPSSTLLLALSPAYLRACADDVLAAAAALASPDQLSVICLGRVGDDRLRDYVLPADARLQHVLGGTRQALNTRLLAHLLTRHEGALLRPALRRATARLLSGLPPVPTYDRRARSDAQVTAFITRRLRASSGASCTRLLREYRDGGYRCEQSRFRRLYDAVLGSPA
jgi:hypothetical protein